MSLSESARVVWVRRHRGGKKPFRPLRLESLEDRRLLSVAAVDDGPFDVNEDASYSNTLFSEALIARKATWSYLDTLEYDYAAPVAYPTDGEGDYWNEPDFNPLPVWPTGPATLGIGTIDGSARRQRFITTRRTWPRGSSVARSRCRPRRRTPIRGMVDFSFDLLSDDGGVLYINGTEVYRTANMTDPTLTTASFADPTGSEQYRNNLNFTRAPPRSWPC